MIFVTVTMAMVYCRIRKVEQASSRYFSAGGRQTKRFAMQAVLYVGVFFFTWFFLSFNKIFLTISGIPTKVEIMITSLAFLPLQGFFNLFVYFLPRWLSSRRTSNKAVISISNVNFGNRRSYMFSSSKSSGSRHSSKRMSVIRMPTAEQLVQWDAEAGESHEFNVDSSELQLTLDASKSTVCNSSEP
jgi:hypothetical protein